MIITMRRDADFSTIKGVVEFFVRTGWDVQVRNGKNGEQAVVAAFGSTLKFNGSLEVERLVGVEMWEKDNKLFIDTNGKDFLEAWEWLRLERAKKGN